MFACCPLALCASGSKVELGSGVLQPVQGGKRSGWIVGVGACVLAVAHEQLFRLRKEKKSVDTSMLQTRGVLRSFV